MNVWTPDVACPTRLDVQCRKFDPVSGPFSMDNERKDEGSVYSVGSRNHLVSIRSRKTFFKKQNQISNLLVIFLCFLVGFLAITVLMLAILYACNSIVKICDSEDCMRIAASLKESMDVSVDPWDNFYQYACGRWSEKHPILDSSLTNSWFDERSDRMFRKIRDLLKVNMSASEVPWAVMQAKTLFASCMDVYTINQLNLSPLFDLLELLNLPMLPAFITNETSNYIEQLARVKRNLGYDVFFGFGVEPDPKNNSNNIIAFYYPSHSNPFPTFTNNELKKRLQNIKSRLRKLDDFDDKKLNEKEKAEAVEITYMTDVIKQVLSNGTVDECTSNNESTILGNELEKFVHILYNISNTLYYVRRADKKNQSITENLSDSDYMLVDDLQRLTDEYIMNNINSSITPKPIWRPFIESLFEGIAKLDLDNRDKILVGKYLEYLKNAALILSTYSEQDLESYIWWSVVKIVVPHSSEKLRNIWYEYVNDLMDVEVGKPRSMTCAVIANELMGMAVSWLFVDPTFHDNEINKVQEMLYDITESFASLVINTDWMDQSTKTATLEKSQNMGSAIGFPTWLLDEEKLDKYYKGISLSETNYLENMVQIVRLQWNAMWTSLQDENLDSESYWATDPTDVNAIHSMQLNHITIPAGILQFPFYELGLAALNYGAIGVILGHELTHGFDNKGRHFDSVGNLRQWWTNETISKYTDKTQCFIDHYNSYYYSEIDISVDGEQTLGENIADNGGLHEAVIGYERWKARHGREPLLPGFMKFTHEQLLFLSYAHISCESYIAASLKWMLQHDSHCPFHVRLEAVLKNSKEFSTAWNCPAGSNMNPSKKCRVW